MFAFLLGVLMSFVSAQSATDPLSLPLDSQSLPVDTSLHSRNAAPLQPEEGTVDDNTEVEAQATAETRASGNVTVGNGLGSHPPGHLL
jgi:hypothetical protein